MIQYASYDEVNIWHRTKLGALIRVSKRMRFITEGVLYQNVEVSPGYSHNPGTNKMAQLLRTLLNRPELGLKIRYLSFQTIRRNFSAFYEKNGFQFYDLRQKSLTQLEKMGYMGHPWYRMVEASIESAYAGLLLTLVPKLCDLNFVVYDGNFGKESAEPTLALFGAYYPINELQVVLNNIKCIMIPGCHVAAILAGPLPKLESLEINMIEVDDLTRLNGSNSLPGASKIKEICITVTAEVINRPIGSNPLDLTFADLFDAFGFTDALELHIRVAGQPKPDVPYDFSSLVGNLQGLYQNLEWIQIGGVDSDEYEDFDVTPVGNLSLFTSLDQLVITEDALLGRLADTDRWWNDNRLEDLLPANLKQLVITNPSSCSVIWLEGLLRLDIKEFPHLKDIYFVSERGVADPVRQINWDQDFQESQLWTLLQEKLQISCFFKYEDESNPILLRGGSEPVIRFADLIENSEQEDSEEDDSGDDNSEGDSEDENSQDAKLGNEDVDDEDADNEEEADEKAEDSDYTNRFGN